MSDDRLLAKAASAKRESKFEEFKTQFDPTTEGEWIELIKNFVAIANSGGGVVVVGVANDGSPAGTNIQPVLSLDAAARSSIVLAVAADTPTTFGTATNVSGRPVSDETGAGGDGG